MQMQAPSTRRNVQHINYECSLRRPNEAECSALASLLQWSPAQQQLAAGAGLLALALSRDNAVMRLSMVLQARSRVGRLSAVLSHLR